MNRNVLLIALALAGCSVSVTPRSSATPVPLPEPAPTEAPPEPAAPAPLADEPTEPEVDIKAARVEALETMQAFVALASSQGVKLHDGAISDETKLGAHGKIEQRPTDPLAKMEWKIDGKRAVLEAFATDDAARKHAENLEAIGDDSVIIRHPTHKAMMRLPRSADARAWENLLLGI